MPGLVFVTFLNQRRKVLAQAGPWRNSGDWWSETSWARDEWDVALVESPSRAHKTRPFGTDFQSRIRGLSESILTFTRSNGLWRDV